MRRELIDVPRLNFEEGAVESLNPNLTVDDQTELLPYDSKWEFPRERLKLSKNVYVSYYLKKNQNGLYNGFINHLRIIFKESN